MNADDISQIIIPLCILFCLGFGLFLWGYEKRQRINKRMARVTNKKISTLQKATDTMALRRKSRDGNIPFIAKFLKNFSVQAAVLVRLDRAGMQTSPTSYITLSAIITVVVFALVVLLGRPIILGFILAFMIGVAAPHFYLGFRGNSRIKKFLVLFPDAIDFIVRSLRSGLPVTEAMNMIGREMEEPVAGIFSSIGESIKLGVPVEKSLQSTAKKLNSTEFNFFVTSIILQRETGGNLSEILSNLSEVLRKRFMMRMKIKAMSSEAKASAIIVGALPFAVISALIFVAPGYLNPLIDVPVGNLIGAGAALSMMLGIGVMYKMTQFEI